nr:hypothetical protein [Tanacetum cinerariifolium]
FSRRVYEKNGGFVSTAYAQGADWAMSILFSKEKGIYVIPEAKVYWRLSGTNISSVSPHKKAQMLSGHVQFVEWVIEHFSYLRHQASDVTYDMMMNALIRNLSVVIVSHYKGFDNKNIISCYRIMRQKLGRQLSLDRNTGLKLDISFFGSQNLRSYKLDNFNVKASVATTEEIADYLDVYSSKSLYAKIRRRIEAMQPKYKRHLFREEQWWTYEPELFKVPADVYIDGYWQHYKYFINLNPKVLDEITLKNKPSAEVEQVISE